jgi:alpha-galactosidase
MLCRAMQRETSVQVTSLCHSVQGTAAMLAGWIGAPLEEITYLCAGINHQAWYVRFERNGKDAYGPLREAVKQPAIYEREMVRNEMFLKFGYYVTESSGHNSEYNWWFRKRADLIEKYCGGGNDRGWNPGEYAFILKEYLARQEDWKDRIEEWLQSKEPLNLKRGREYAASIINAFLGGSPFRFNGNVPNLGLISNLPEEACVEVPVYADRNGFSPIPVGALPPQCAALNNVSVAVEEMAVEGCLSGDPAKVFHAVAYDPLTAAVLSLEEIRIMVNEMLETNRDHLPTFRHFSV